MGAGEGGVKRMRGNFKKMAARGDLGGFEVKGHALLSPPFLPFFMLSVFPFHHSVLKKEILSRGGELKMLFSEF